MKAFKIKRPDLSPNCDNQCAEKLVMKIPDRNDWVYEPTSPCMKNLVKKFVYTTTYREMNRDGAVGPIMVKTKPKTFENPKEPFATALKIPEPRPIIKENVDNFLSWDRPQVRTSAGRCDTMANCPTLDYDSYFQEQYLRREKFARHPTAHDLPTKVNLDLAKSDMLRYPFDKMIPGHGGYKSLEAPAMSKVKNVFDRTDPWDPLSVHQCDYIRFPKDAYEKRVKPIKNKLNLGFVNNPFCTLSQTQLPITYRLSPYLECQIYPTLVCDPNPSTDVCPLVPEETLDNKDDCQPL